MKDVLKQAYGLWKENLDYHNVWLDAENGECMLHGLVTSQQLIYAD